MIVCLVIGSLMCLRLYVFVFVCACWLVGRSVRRSFPWWVGRLDRWVVGGVSLFVSLFVSVVSVCVILMLLVCVCLLVG